MYTYENSGRELVGVYMHNWEEVDETGHCSSQKNWQDVQTLCKDINIPCTRVDFIKEYWSHVFRYVAVVVKGTSMQMCKLYLYLKSDNFCYFSNFIQSSNFKHHF